MALLNLKFESRIQASILVFSLGLIRNDTHMEAEHIEPMLQGWPIPLKIPVGVGVGA